MTILLRPHVLDCVLGEMALAEAPLHQPWGILVVNILGGMLILRISCCCFAVAEICFFFFLVREKPSEMYNSKRNPHRLLEQSPAYQE